uniref:Lipoprotein n=1 Tax=Candidatus Kentrum sp. LFY TaxID=2126342 RepID=A0A450USS9_9GAMM|nr:MAG: hypothetical protein BECKLFY1418A_GA0070994_10513 [Candidatus Kentron sp. LFY]
MNPSKKLSSVTSAAVMLALSGCATVSQPVYKVPENNDCTQAGVSKGMCKKFDGIPYVLPRTALKITIPVVTTTQKEGSFVSEAREIFAKKEKEGKCKWKEDNECSNEFWGKFEEGGDACLKRVFDRASEVGVKIEKDRKYGQITTNRLGKISVASEAMPDPKQLYFVEAKGGMFENRGVDITFAPGGIFKEITASAEDKTVEFAAKTLGSVLGAVAKFGYHTGRDDSNGCTSDIYKNVANRALDKLAYIEEFQGMRADMLTEGVPGEEKTKFELRL